MATTNRYTVKDLIRSVREGASTSLGCYPKFYVTADGGVLSPEAVKANLCIVARATRDGFEKGWSIVGCDVNWEDPDLYCDDTGKRIPSAYAEEGK